MITDLTNAVIQHGGEALVYVEATRGDETPLRARARSSASQAARDQSALADPAVPIISDLTDENTVKQKIVQSDWNGAVAYRLGCGDRYIIAKFNLLTWLQCIDRGAAECNHHCLSTVRPCFEFAKMFKRHVHVSTTDKDAAIARAFNRPA
eukprot:2944468-Pyramimonas_sp.AAC.1